MISKSIAKKVIDLTSESGKQLGEIVYKLDGNCTEKEFMHHKKAVSNILALMFDIMNPLIKKYPELGSDYLKNDSKHDQ